MTLGKTLNFVDSSDSSIKLSIGQIDINAHSLKITSLGDATNPTDALNLQTADARYLSAIDNDYYISNTLNSSRVECAGDNLITLKVNNNTLGSIY